jgi:hypothetical protein
LPRIDTALKTRLTMDESAVKAIVDDRLESLTELFGLYFWRIEVKFEATRRPDQWRAMCDREVNYSRATITLDPTKFDTEDEVIKALEHELLHVVLAPFDLYRNLVTQHIGPEEVALTRVEQTAWEYMIEQQVINLERMLYCVRASQGVQPMEPPAG